MSIVEKSNSCIFVLCGVVGRVEGGRFSEDGSFESFGGFVNGDVQVVYNVVPFSFCSE